MACPTRQAPCTWQPVTSRCSKSARGAADTVDVPEFGFVAVTGTGEPGGAEFTEPCRRWERRITMMTSATSRRAFLAGSAVAVGGLAIADRLVLGTATKTLTGRAAGPAGRSIRDMAPGHGSVVAAPCRLCYWPYREQMSFRALMVALSEGSQGPLRPWPGLAQNVKSPFARAPRSLIHEAISLNHAGRSASAGQFVSPMTRHGLPSLSFVLASSLNS